MGKQEEHLTHSSCQNRTHVASEALALGAGKQCLLALPPQGPLLPPSGPSLLLAGAADDKTQIQGFGTIPMAFLSPPSHLSCCLTSQPTARGHGGSLLPPAFRVCLVLSSFTSHLLSKPGHLTQPALKAEIKGSPLTLSPRSRCNTTSTSGCGFPWEGSRELLHYHSTFLAQPWPAPLLPTCGHSTINSAPL